MFTKTAISCVAFLCSLIFCPDALSQTDSTATGQLVEITLKDGTQLIGAIISEDAESIRFMRIGQIEMIIPRHQIKSMAEFRGEIVDGRIRRSDPNLTRLFFAPTARAMGTGRGYMSDFQIFFTFFGYGLTDYMNLAGGISLLPGADAQLFYLAPKLIPLKTDNIDLAAGVLYISTTNSDFQAGIVYSAGTYGNSSKAITIGAGWGFVEDEFSSKPILLAGGELQLSNSVKIITENWIPINANIQLLSLGIRFFGDYLAGDLAFYWPANTDMEGFPFIPWLGFTYNFDLNK